MCVVCAEEGWGGTVGGCSEWAWGGCCDNVCLRKHIPAHGCSTMGRHHEPGAAKKFTPRECPSLKEEVLPVLEGNGRE